MSYLARPQNQSSKIKRKPKEVTNNGVSWTILTFFFYDFDFQPSFQYYVNRYHHIQREGTYEKVLFVRLNISPYVGTAGFEQYC